MHPERRTPQQVEAQLGSSPTAAGEARELTRAALRRWNLPALLDPVVLAVSELVGNAVRHGQPPVALAVRRARGAVVVEVHDEASAEPRDRPVPDEQAESGRGLQIVEAVAGDTGVRDIPGDGKVAWAQFPLDEPGPPERRSEAEGS